MSTDHKLLNKIKKTILKHNMIQAGDKIIAAVSGGPDSICLAYLLADLSKEMDIELIIAHYEHGLRPKEDTFETNLVKEFATSLNIHFETEKAQGLKPESSSLEEKARKLRYDFLERIREKHNAHKIAMGHNLNDQAETVLMRLLRGSGMTGLSGIPPVRDDIIIRPLIEISRKEIIEYLQSKNLKYATDSSNNDTRFLRNKLRHELLPEMTRYQPELINILGNLADNLRDENSYFEDETIKWVEQKITQDESGDYSFDINNFKDLPSALKKRVIRNIIMRHSKSLYGINSSHVQAVIDLINNTKPNIPVDLPGKLIARKEYSRFIFTSQAISPVHFQYEVRNSGELKVREINRTINFEELDNKQDTELINDNNTALLDMALLPYPLVLRNFKAGDRFIPLGMTGHKKIKDFFIDLKIPPAKRKQTPVLLKGDDIAWVCGYRIDDRFKITSNTIKILKITLQNTV